MAASTASASRPPRAEYGSLRALASKASTSRVLNLGVIADRHGDDPAHAAQPMFESAALNRCIVLKHRLRSNEAHLVGGGRTSATKLLFPYNWDDLGMGGRSVLVGERNYREAIAAEMGRSAQVSARDTLALDLIDSLPSLDPFLLREQLAHHDIRVADFYFDISESDVARMRAFVGAQIGTLIQLALGRGAAGGDELAAETERMVDAILSPDGAARLGVLRTLFGMEESEFAEGIFCWKGVLYYKWCLVLCDAKLTVLLDQIRALRLAGQADYEARAHLPGLQKELMRAVVAERRAVAETLARYDHAYAALTGQGSSGAFRDFLRDAPRMFIDLGERLGTLTHLQTYWQYRFGNGSSVELGAQEAITLLREFIAGLTHAKPAEVTWA